MKTIFVTSFHAHISRNILSTDAYQILHSRPDLRIVLLVPYYKVDYFQKNFGGQNVIIKGVGLYQSSKGNRWGLLFKRLAMFLFDTDTRRLKKQYKFHRDHKALYYYASMFAGFLGRSHLIRKIIRWFDERLSPKDFFLALIDKHKPDLIFSTDILDENDASLMQAAQARWIPIVGMFRSWDNPTQSMMRVLPDKLLVGSEAVREETIQFHDYPTERIVVVGNPHYDRYLEGPTRVEDLVSVRRENIPRNMGVETCYENCLHDLG